MKITAILLFAACLQVSAKTYSQITLREFNAPLQKVFKEIQKQSGYNFLCSLEILQEAGNVTLDLTDVSLQDALNACLRDKLLTYSIVEKTVVIKPDPSKILEQILPPLPMNIHGRVINEKGEPVVGATVSIKGTDREVSTNEYGEFTLDNVNTDATLVITATNIETLTIPVNGRSSLNLIAKTKVSPLDEIQVIAYGNTTKRFSVGSYSTVDAATIEKQPVSNPLLALEGQAPGLAVNATSGVPGSQVLVQVRGQNTLMSSANGFNLKPYDQPLFIIDGVPFATQNARINQLQSLANANYYNGAISQSGGVSPFNNINPQDIESITILKDADATSIYGTEGSNGVILITTKKGHEGKTDFNLSLNTGFNSTIRSIKLLNTQQYIQYRKDVFAANGVTPGNDPNDYSSYAPDLTIFDQNKYTDWQKVLVGKTSNNTDIHASLSGGANNNTFLISAGYTRSTYNYPGNYADQRWSLHSTFHHSAKDNRFSIDFITDYGYDQNNSPGGGGTQYILLPPNMPDLIDPSGNLIWNYKGVDLSAYQFYASLKKPSNLQNYNLNNSLHFSYRILKGLSFKRQCDNKQRKVFFQGKNK